MPIYDDQTFDKSVIPNHLKKEVREVIEAAVMVGWTLHVTTKTGCTITAPGDPSPKKYHFGAGGGRQTISRNRMLKDIAKYGDPQKVLIAIEAGHSLPQAAIYSLPLVGDPGTVVDERPETEPEKVRHPKPSPPPRKKAEPEPEVPTVNSPERTLVSQGPLLAKSREGQGYFSEATIERLWSDGTKDYICSWHDCTSGPDGGPYQSDKRLGVRSHYGMHTKGDGPTPTPPRFAAEVPEAQHYAPRQTRIDALAAELRRAYEAGEEPDFDALARTALTWVHEQSRKGTDLSAEREEMTPEETLNRIRTLLDDGSFLHLQQQINAAQEQIERLTSGMADAESRVMREAARADEAEGNLTALSDLLTELRRHDERANA